EGERRISRQIREQRRYLEKLGRRMVHPRRRLDDLRLRLDEDYTRLKNAMDRLVSRNRERLAWHEKRLFAAPIRARIRALADRRAHLEGRLKTAAAAEMQRKRGALESLYGRMYALSPAAVLERGYSITRRLPDGAVLTDAGMTEAGQDIEVLLSKGSITARIHKVNKNGKKEF
ncbi:MAG: hypothetical protein KGY42_02815, partial [Desulfobacterales bacterium]|nr:hypothetical protein [Desulfobacterales bacterium]